MILVTYFSVTYLCTLDGRDGMPISLGGVPEPTSKDEPVGPVEGTPKNEEAAKEGMADGGLMGGKVEEPPRKPPER